MNTGFIFVLGISAAIISLVGATFSIMGLTKLFSGAPLAVGIMAAALELAKMVSASFLHRNWLRMNILMKAYLSFAVVVLMLITSMGIFGYLSYAYQRTSKELKDTLVRIDYLQSEDRKVRAEKERIQAEIDMIPENRITRKLETQKELEPRLQQLEKHSIEITMKLRNEELKKLSFQTEIGPVIYVAELFGANSDKVATWLIITFVIVFDPLAVCLILATTWAITHRDELIPSHHPATTSKSAA